ncbi:DUF397 domain-containing protein [Streptomyces physcomitrii]|uniref:DUF397 domain-containing protein n=1 Tax=Streptomyces physcomitrii TaxID=2724184 RepID=A0ABX1H729_9ACTN|nr:DUF397 domain-containing protein [Streptomyces physcomitrii]NKI43049.1 DUF397 domain-containing protein [Streptomyces physcomitrii]
MNSSLSSASPGELTWTKSSYSGTNGNCLETAQLPGESRAVRDSKIPHGPVLGFSAAHWAKFTAGVKAGQIA